MRLSFTKMHGAGNDFAVIDATRAPFTLDEAARRRLGDRRFGIGFDQLLVIEPATDDADFRYRIFNADGSEAEQCGNGARCVARFIRERGLSGASRLRLSTLGGVIETELLADGSVRVNMGVPRFAPKDIPFLADEESQTYPIDVDGETFEIGAVSMGNPHAVLLVDDVDAAAVTTLGLRLERHERFPARVNVGFMQILDEHRIRLRVFERGAGETLACGTGACAAAVHGMLTGRLKQPVEVSLPGGTLVVSWNGHGEPVFLAGPAVTVYEGSIQP